MDAYKFDQTTTSIHIHEQLKQEHFNLDPALQMRNHLAEDVLDKKDAFPVDGNGEFSISPFKVNI